MESKIRLSSRVADMLAHASDVVKEEITGRAVNEVVLETAANLFEVFDDDPLPSIQKESVCNDLQSSAVMGAKSEAEPEPITRKQVREWVMDRRIAKDFGSGLGVFLGRVVNVYDVTSKTLDKALFRVLYTDGDKEDLNAVELYGTFYVTQRRLRVVRCRLCLTVHFCCLIFTLPR